MKSDRHSKILDIINERPIETQDELLSILKSEGYKATQATISRDIKDLRLVKTLGSDGKYRYVSPENNFQESSVTSLIATAVKAIDSAQNIVVIKTHGGMAQAVCASIDSFNFNSVVGTIAGDDTIFVACRSADMALGFTAEIKKLIKQG